MLGAAYVELRGRPEPLYDSLNKSESHVKGWGSRLVGSMGSAGKAAFSAFAAGSVALTNGLAAAFAHAVKAGSDMNEAMDAAKTQFGSGASVITEGAQKMADEFHRSKLEFTEGAIRLGVFGASMGKGEKQAASFGVEMARLAAQIGSDKNVPMADMIDKLASGLAGETEPLRRFGLVMSEADVQAAGWALGLAKVGDELDAQSKVAARAALIQAGFAKSQGNLEKTAGSMANRMAAAKGQIENAWIDLGMALQPAAVRMAEVIGRGMSKAESYLSAARETFASWADKVADAFEWVGDKVVAWGPTVEKVFASVMTLVAPLGQVIADAYAGIGARLEVVGSFLVANQDVVFAWGKAFADACSTVNGWMGKVYDFIGGQIEGIVDAFRYWDAVVEDTDLRIGQFGTDVGVVIDWLLNAWGSYGAWFGNNFVNLFIDALKLQYLAYKNFVGNIINLASEMFEYIASGGKQEFDFGKLNLVGDLGRGFQANTEALPAIGMPEFNHSATDNARQKLWDGVAKQEEQRLGGINLGGGEEGLGATGMLAAMVGEGVAKGMRQGPEGSGGFAGKGANTGDLDIGDTEDRKSQVLKIADLGRKAQESQGKDDVPKKQLKKLEDIEAAIKAQETLRGPQRTVIS